MARKTYELTDDELQALKELCRPVQGETALEQKWRVNGAWIALGDAMGFDAGTVMPITEHKFSAEELPPDYLEKKNESGNA